MVFCSYRCFLESEKLRCEKKFGSFFFFHFFLVKRFGYDFVLILAGFGSDKI